MLDRRDGLPRGFLEVTARQLHRVLPNPTLMRIAGNSDRPALFIAVLQHGNEDTGLIAVQRLLREMGSDALARPIWLFVGSPAAARHGVRTVAGRPDLNRCWPGTDTPDCDETRMLARVIEIVRSEPLLASVDLHNTSGESPPHVGVNRLDPPFLRLAQMFAPIAVLFDRPLGAQSRAFAPLCPAVTVECGRVGNPVGIEHTKSFLYRLLEFDRLRDEAVPVSALALYRSVARVFVAPGLDFAFGNTKPATLQLDASIDRFNFRELDAGTMLGYCAADVWPVTATSPEGNDVTACYFTLDQGALRLRRPVMPSLLTTDPRIVREDCLCQLTERICRTPQPATPADA